MPTRRMTARVSRGGPVAGLVGPFAEKFRLQTEGDAGAGARLGASAAGDADGQWEPEGSKRLAR
eukprot:10165939-Lingulodinium_polyedra.AAC.1